MVAFRLGDPDEARSMYFKAKSWLSGRPYLMRNERTLLAEAEELLGIESE
jgi:hypothetical protein